MVNEESNNVGGSKSVFHNTACWNCGSRTYYYYPDEISLNIRLYRVYCTDCNRLIEDERAETMLTESGIIQKVTN